MHSVDLEEVFQTVCLDFYFVTGQNPPNFIYTKPNAVLADIFESV